MDADSILQKHANSLLNLMGRSVTIKRGSTVLYEGKAIFAPVSDDSVDGSIRKNNSYYNITIPVSVVVKNRDIVLLSNKKFIVSPEDNLRVGLDGFDKLQLIRILYTGEVSDE